MTDYKEWAESVLTNFKEAAGNYGNCSLENIEITTEIEESIIYYDGTVYYCCDDGNSRNVMYYYLGSYKDDSGITVNSSNTATYNGNLQCVKGTFWEGIAK